MRAQHHDCVDTCPVSLEVATMNITLTLGDFLMIAAIVVIFARGAHAWFAGPTAQDLRTQRQLDAIMQHLGLPDPPVSRAGALSPQVAALLAAGRKIDALRLYRQETGESLRQAKAAIDHSPAVVTASR
jgi:large subunit ribosomal protein L7/L12